MRERREVSVHHSREAEKQNEPGPLNLALGFLYRGGAQRKRNDPKRARGLRCCRPSGPARRSEPWRRPPNWCHVWPEPTTTQTAPEKDGVSSRSEEIRAGRPNSK